MNKFLYIFSLYILCVISTTAQAQYVIDDRYASDGSREIQAKDKKFNIGATKYSINLGVSIHNQKKMWWLVISSFSYISSNAQVLIKLGNNELIYLHVNNVNVNKVTFAGSGYIIGNVVTTIPSRQVDYYSSAYLITEKELRQIFEHKIKKIRILRGEYYDEQEFFGKRLCKLLSDSYEDINYYLSTTRENKNIFDNF